MAKILTKEMISTREVANILVAEESKPHDNHQKNDQKSPIFRPWVVLLKARPFDVILTQVKLGHGSSGTWYLYQMVTQK